MPRILLPFLLLFASLASLAQPWSDLRRVAVDQIRKDRFTEALATLNMALVKEPGVPELWYLRGYTKYSLDDYIGAEQDYTQSIQISPYLADVFVNRAVVRSQLQNYKGAIDDYNRALELDTANGEIYFYRARTNLLMKRVYSCIVDCNKAIALKCEGEGVWILRASAETEIKRYDGALEDLEKAGKINPANPDIFSQRGQVWMELEKTDSAIADLSRAVRLDTANSYALFSRALAYLKKPDYPSALKDLNQVVRISPYNSYAYYNRAIVLVNLGDKSGAIRDFGVVSKLDPKNIVSCFYRARLKAELGDYPGALEDLDRSIELLPDYTDAWYERYEVKLKLKDTKGAQADYRHALELSRCNNLDPDSLAAGRKDYLKSLVKLSGDFEQMNSFSSKFQNQAVDIQLRQPFAVLLWKADYGRVRLYDAYSKPHYFTTVVTFANEQGLVSDSLLHEEVARTGRAIDSAGLSPELLFRRAVALHWLRSYEKSIDDFDRLLAADSGHIAGLIGRACARYELIRQLAAREEERSPAGITLGRAPARPATGLVAPDTLEHTYASVLRDLDRALALDPSSAFTLYDRGFVNSTMGNYRASIDDFSKAIALRADLAEAWYNRGLMNILLGENRTGCLDLSRAGELGISDAYRVMKRYCYK